MKRLNFISKKITLTEKEKQVLRLNLEAVVRDRPIMENTEGVRTPGVLRHIQRVGFGFQSLLFKPIKIMPAILLIVLLGLGGGTSYAAEGSLPGDVLYPVKVSINEPVRAGLAFSTEAKAKVETDLAVRRLEEAESLVVGGKLDAKTEADLAARFEAFADKAEEHAAKLAEQSDGHAAVEAGEGLEVALRVHERILAKLGLNASKDSPESSRIKDKVSEHLQLQVKSRIEAESGAKAEGDGGSSSVTAAEGRLKAAENKIEEAEKFIEKKADRATLEQKAEAQVQISSAKNKVIEGKAELEAKNSAGAFSLFGEASREAQSAKLMLDLTGKLQKVEAEAKAEAKKQEKGDTADKTEADVKKENNNTGNRESDKNGGDNGGEAKTEAESEAEVKVQGETKIEGSTGSGKVKTDATVEAETESGLRLKLPL